MYFLSDFIPFSKEHGKMSKPQDQSLPYVLITNIAMWAVSLTLCLLRKVEKWNVQVSDLSVLKKSIDKKYSN